MVAELEAPPNNITAPCAISSSTLAAARSGLDAVLARNNSSGWPLTPPWLLISFTSDWLFPTSESRLIVNALMSNACDVSFVEIETNRGHDSFLIKVPRFYNILRGFLSGVSFND